MAKFDYWGKEIKWLKIDGSYVRSSFGYQNKTRVIRGL